MADTHGGVKKDGAGIPPEQEHSPLSRTLRALILLAFGLALPWIAGLFPWVVEATYVRFVFPAVADIVNTPSTLLPFSLAQILLILAVAGLVLLLPRSVRRTARARSLKAGFGPLHRWISTAAILVWAFHFLWGLNYSRPRLIDRLPLEAIEPDPRSLARMTLILGDEANRTYGWAVKAGQIEPDTLGSRLTVSGQVVGERLTSAYNQMLPGYVRVRMSPPKIPRVLSPLMSRVGVSGFYFPLTGEASVNGQIPGATLPSVMAHEMAHQRGIAPEDEANFLAYIACRESGLPAARYSGALHAFKLAALALHRADPELYSETVQGLLDPGPARDISAIRRFWSRHSGPVSDAAQQANHAYLRMNTQREGIRSYDQAIRLILAWEASGGLDDD